MVNYVCCFRSMFTTGGIHLYGVFPNNGVLGILFVTCVGIFNKSVFLGFYRIKGERENRPTNGGFV